MTSTFLSLSLTSRCLHSSTKVSPLLLQLGQVVSDFLLLLHHLFLLCLQSLGISLHTVLPILTLVPIYTRKVGFQKVRS